MQYQTLNAERLLETQRRLAERIKARFPSAGLVGVAGELTSIAQDATIRAEWIRRPQWALRVAVAVLLVGALALGVWMTTSVQLRADLKDAKGLFEFVEMILRTTVFLGAVVVFLITVEIRLKRRRALAALHELRAIAHVVDMHQVAKSPEGHRKDDPFEPASPSQSTKSLIDLRRYLHYCGEMLAIVSKIAALYVQRFPDAPTVIAVDQVEVLCSSLSQRIWQKIVVLDQFRELEELDRPMGNS